MPITIYGNALPGDHPAIFTGAFEARYPRGMRILFGFAILNADCQTPHDGPDGGGLWAVAVCNRCAGDNPKSKSFLIRKAMLQLEEFQNPALSIVPPPPEHFETPFGDRLRVLDIRVVRRETNGTQLSVVTHICRPRDAEWQSIEGVFEGPQHGDQPRPERQPAEHPQPARPLHMGQPAPRNERPFWLREDGTATRFDDEQATLRVQSGLWQRGVEPTAWLIWNQTTPDQLQQFRNDDGSLRILIEEEIAALQGLDAVRYHIAQMRAGLGLPLG